MAFQWAQDDPRFQRTLQKMRAMSPESRAIFNAGAAEEAWAATDAAKSLRLMQIGNELQNQKRSFQINMDYRRGQQDLRRQELAQSAHQSRRARHDRSRENRWGMIMGATNLGTTALLSRMRNRSAQREAADTRAFRRSLLNQSNWGQSRRGGN